MLGIDPMEPTEKPLTAASLRRVLLLRLRPSAILVSALVPTAAPVLVLVRGCRYVVDLTVCLLQQVILPPLRLVPLPLLLLLLHRIGSVKPSAAAFIGFSIFLHHFKEFLQRLRLDSIEHILAVSNPQAPNNGVDDAAFGHPGARDVSLTTLCMYSCSDSLSPWTHMLTRSLEYSSSTCMPLKLDNNLFRSWNEDVMCPFVMFAYQY
jgi:hypothetical protein